MTCDVWSLIAEATAKLITRAPWYRRCTMIPYDDLVAALSAWRARQGLPVSTMGGGSAAPSPGSGPHASYGQPSSGPQRGAPPPAPVGKATPPMGEEMHEVDEAEMLEEHYDNEGNDYAMSFGAGDDGESTAMGSAPERPTDPSDFRGGGGGGGGGRVGRGGRDDW